MWFAVLGAIEASAHTPLRLSSRRQRALLGMLICHRDHVVSVDRLVEAIWEDDIEPQRGKAALQTVVSRLRTAISAAGGDPTVIASDDSGYRLVAGATQIDASVFEALIGDGAAFLSGGASDLAADALEEAVGMFRGEPYEEFAHCSWARAEATRLSERYADAIELLATALLDRGAHREAIPRLESAIEAYPYREGLQTALMTALYRCGRHTDALRSYRTFRNVLVEDLGLEPSRELREHEGRILRHDPALDAPMSGRPLRGYRLHEQTGSSHLGAVWRATQPGVGREVSVTVVDPDLALSASLLTDLDSMAHALGQLDHPNICAVLDVWSDTTGTYVVSRLARGTSLEALCAAGSLTVPGADTIMRQVRAALDHAHGCGVGHGGLNDSQVAIDANGDAHVTGWGVRATTEVLADDDEAMSLLATRLGVERPPPTGTRPNPYRGLAAFHEAEAHWFFGRERVVDELIKALVELPFVTIIGASGSGKSSLMGAGLTFALRSGHVAQFEGWEIVSLSPTARPQETLASAIERCKTDESSPDRGLIILFDQLEELFTMADPRERDALITDLVAVVSNDAVPARIVATLRADHLEAPLSHLELGPLIRPSLSPIGPMTTSELARAISLPAAAVGAIVDDELVGELIGEIGSQPNALPLMQFALTELFDLHGGDDLTLDQFRRLGGLEGAIARRAETVFGALDDHARALTRTMFAKLVSIGDDGSWARRRVPVRDVVNDNDDATEVLDSFVSARLLAVEVDSISREPFVSMTHEALAREWPRLVGWMEADREAIGDLRDLRGSIGPWLASGRDDDRLLRGASLARATAAASARPDLLSTDEGEFLAASTRLASAANHRARRITAAVAILAAVALIGAGLAFFQRQDARASAESERQARFQTDLGRLALQAQVLANGPTDLALLLAVESWRRQPTPSSEAALLTALTARPLLDRYIAPDSPDQLPVDSLDLTATGQLIVRRSSLIEVRDATTLEGVGVSFDIGANDTLAVRNDSSEIATSNEDGRIQRWDLASGLPIPGELAVADGAGPPLLDYANDGRIIATDPDDGLIVVDPTDGTSRHVPVGEPISVIVADPLSPHVIAASELTTYLVPIDGAAVEVLPGLSGARQLSFSRDGTRLFVVTSQSRAQAGSLYEIDATALREAERPTSGFETLRDAYVPLPYPSGVLELEDSRIVVTGELGRAVVLDPTWRSSTVVDLGTGMVVARDDGTLVGATDRSLALIDVDGRGVLGRPLGDGLSPAASISADGARIAAQTPDGVEVTDLVSGSTAAIIRPTSGFAVPLLSPDGATVALRSAYEVEFVDVETNRLLGEPISVIGGGPSFSPDGSLVAVSSFVGIVVRQLPSLDVVAAVPPREPGDLVTDFAWSPDGSQLALASQRGPTRIVEARTGADIAPEISLAAGSQLRWSSDGSRIAVIAPGGPSRIIDARTGDTIRDLPSVGGPVELARWTRSDQRLVIVRAAEPDDAVVEFIDTATGERVGPPSRVAELSSFTRGLGRIADDELFLFPVGAPAVSITTDPAEWARLACEVAGRTLTESEWATYLQNLGPWRPTCPVAL